MKNTIVKVLAIFGAIAACATLLFLFRDKINALLEKCRCKKDDCDLNDLEGSVEAAIETAEEKVEEFVEEAKQTIEHTVETAREKAEAIAEEFKDYADVDPEEKPEE